jgi:hypothetical protein
MPALNVSITLLKEIIFCVAFILEDRKEGVLFGKCCSDASFWIRRLTLEGVNGFLLLLKHLVVIPSAGSKPEQSGNGRSQRGD